MLQMLAPFCLWQVRRAFPVWHMGHFVFMGEVAVFRGWNRPLASLNEGHASESRGTLGLTFFKKMFN